MTKYSPKMVTDVEEWIAEHGLMLYGGAKLGDFLKAFKIQDGTYYQWLRKPEFSEAVARARDTFKANLTIDIAQSLADAAKGGEYEKTKERVEYVREGKREKQVRRFVDTEKGFNPPNVGAAIFLLTNLDPERYQNRQRSDVAISRDVGATMTLDEINAEIERLTSADE